MRRALIIAVAVLIIATWLLTTGDAPGVAFGDEPIVLKLAPEFDGIRSNVPFEGAKPR